MRLLVLGLVCLPVLGACEPAPPVVDLEAERASLSEAADAYHEAALRLDVDALVVLNAANVILLPPNEPEENGTEGAQRILEGFTQLPNFHVDFTTREVEVGAGGDMGYTLAAGVLSYDGPDGDTVRDEIRDFHVWTKQEDGSWKVAVDIWNSQLPVASPGP